MFGLLMRRDEPWNAGLTNVTFRVPVTYSDVFFGEWNVDKINYFMWYTHIPLSIVITALYLLMVLFTPRYMKNREAFDLRWPLTIWNLSLSLYSGISFYYLAPYVFRTYMKGGVVGMFCYNEDLYTDPVSGYVTWLYTMSKGPELLDTLFLILRKRPVIFMHWYHHFVTFMVGQVFYTAEIPWARYIFIINLSVHTVMYSYYGLRAAGIPTPGFISKFITCFQITQFSSAFYVLARVGYAHVSRGIDNCEADRDMIILGTILVSTYLYLFVEYFHLTYVLKKSPTRRKDAVEEKKTE